VVNLFGIDGKVLPAVREIVQRHKIERQDNMIQKCKCGKLRNAQPYRYSGEGEFVCSSCWEKQDESDRKSEVKEIKNG